MLKKLALALVFLALPGISLAGNSNIENSAAQICKGPVSISCASTPCFPFGSEGADFSGANNNYWVSINLTAGTFSLDVEGTAPGGVFGTLSTFTTGVNGYLTSNPPLIRPVVNACSSCVGQIVICGNN